MGASCASKGGIDMLTRQFAVKLAPHDVMVNVVAPGTISTEIDRCCCHSTAPASVAVRTTMLEDRVPLEQGRRAHQHCPDGGFPLLEATATSPAQSTTSMAATLPTARRKSRRHECEGHLATGQSGCRLGRRKPSLVGGRAGAVYRFEIKRPHLRRLQLPGGGEGSGVLADARLHRLRRPAPPGQPAGRSRTGLAVRPGSRGRSASLPPPRPRFPPGASTTAAATLAASFWVGAMSTIRREPTATLYCLQSGGRCRKMLDGASIPNGLAWSPDGHIMSFADTMAGAIDAFDYDLTDGITSNRRAFARTAGQPGDPDGATVDADGFFLDAQYDGGCVTRYAPDGRVHRRVALPVQRPTSCAFGGPRLDTLFVTTASQELSAAELAVQPLAGRVLALDAGVCGRLEPQFAASRRISARRRARPLAGVSRVSGGAHGGGDGQGGAGYTRPGGRSRPDGDDLPGSPRYAVGTKSLRRPHIKGQKVPQIAHAMIAAGAIGVTLSSQAKQRSWLPPVSTIS